MATDLIRYDLLVQDALRGVVRTVLADAARNGLQGDHHFFITFKTNAPGLRLSDRMRERYPDEMTIILQHQFWDLGVTDHAFEVGLSFSNKPERLLVPFAAITTFHDPSVQFGLKFDLADAGVQDGEPEAAAPLPAPAGKTAAGKTTPGKRLLAAVDPVRESANEPAPAALPAPAKAATTVPPTAGEAPARDKDRDKDKPDGSGEAAKVVSIDAFRKKP